MKQIGQILNKTSPNPSLRRKSPNHSTEWQVVGSYYAHKLGAKSPTHYGAIIKAVKLYPAYSAHAFSFAVDYPNAKSLINLFFWKLHQLRKEA